MVWRSFHNVARGVVLADWLFTTPAGIIQPATGIALVLLQGWSWTEDWLILTYILYIVAFLAWVPVVYLQIRIRDLTKDCSTNECPPEARRLFRIWFALGWPAFISLIAIFWLMVNKPDLW